jgi:hypothetical protein
MPDLEGLKSQIRSAFAGVEFPGDWCLRGSNDGNEPYLLEQEFKGKSDWAALDAKFLDQAPSGYGTALCFFSDEAFRFYLPAYLIADIDGLLELQDPVFHLAHGLSDADKTKRVNPRRYGERTWFEAAQHQFAVFNREQGAVIVAYLRYKRQMNQLDRERIDQALANFWLRRAGEDAV